MEKEEEGQFFKGERESWHVLLHQRWMMVCVCGCCTSTNVLHCMPFTRSFGFCECFATSAPQVPLGWWAELQLPFSPGE